MTNEQDTAHDQMLPLDLGADVPPNQGPGVLDELDPEFASTLTSRRGIFGRAAAALGAVATAPMLLASATNEAHGLGLGPFLPAQVVDVLNFALTLERLEAQFYSIGLSTPGLIPDRFRAVYAQIGKHENEHVASLSLVLGLAASAPSQFDFTARGRYPGVFSNYGTFAAMSQAFEDLGVKAYKGQAPNLMGSPLILTTALRIHSVEARHAAEIRRIRGHRPWDGPFDSPLSKAQVLAIAGRFIVG